MSPSRSEIISSHPIGGRLEEYREIYSICQYPNEPNPLLQKEVDDGTKNMLLDFLMAVQVLPACRILSSSRGSGTLFGDISRVSSTIDSGQAQIDRLLPLLKAVHDKEPDEIIWDKVYEAVTESTPSPRPLPPFQQTPLTRNTGSVVNSSELRTDMDPVLREELGPLHVDVPRLYDAFFGNIPELQANAQAVFER
ncbi:hypothetical protein LOZ66_006985, partial [Ophidiomyces ophidiicola]